MYLEPDEITLITVRYPLPFLIAGMVFGAAGLYVLICYLGAPMQIHSDFIDLYLGQNPAYPPSTLLFFRLFSVLPLEIAFALWSFLSLIFYFGALWGITNTLRLQLTPVLWVLLIGLSLGWYPFLAHMALGQVSLLLFASMVGGWVALRRGREGLAGVLFGFATAMKLFPGLTLFYLFMRHHWRALVWASATTALGLLLPWGVIQLWMPELNLLGFMGPNSLTYAVYPINLSLTGVISRLLIDGPWVEPLWSAAYLVPPILLLIALAILGWAGWQYYHLPSDASGDAFSFAYNCIAMILLSPISWQHILPFIWLPLLILLRGQALKASGVARCLVYVAFLLFSLPDIEIARMLMEYYAPYRIPRYAAWPFLLPTVGLATLSVALLLQQRAWWSRRSSL